ncbi:MAG: FAD-dependent monooxygenase [Thermonemataceae bacterium]
MKIIIIGGSIGGLSAGIALNCKNFDVEIYERSTARMRGRGAGLVIQPDMMDYLMQHNISPKEIFGVPALERQVLNNQGRVAYKFQNDTTFTSWNYIWQQLKDHFPDTKYFYGHELSKVEQKGKLATATFTNGVVKTADLIIGADGYGSVVRAHFLPEVTPTYAGYIAYRGLIPEEKMTQDVVSFFENKFSIYPYEHAHILCYMVPGTNGELEKGQRQLNWVWYVNKTASQLSQILTDKDGENRKYAVPPTFLSQKSVDDLHALADEELPQVLRDRVHQTQHPFVQVIVDMNVPKMFDNRLAVLGDAASVVRPHTASGTAKAYRDAIALADCLFHHEADIAKALRHWNDQQLREATGLTIQGLKLASGSGLGNYH